jgi:hypothetical protein
LQAFVHGQPVAGEIIHSGGFHALVNDLKNMVATDFRGQIVVFMQFNSIGKPVIEIFPPVVEGNDLEQVGNAAKLGGGLEQRLGVNLPQGGETVTRLDQPRFFRRSFQITLGAKGAVSVLLGRIEGRWVLRTDANGAVAATGDRPYFGSGKGVDLLDGAVSHPHQIAGFGNSR